MRKDKVMIFVIMMSIFLSYIVVQVHGEVASCQAHNHGALTSCIEFASSKSIPKPLEKICTSGGSTGNKWVTHPCPRAGSIGYCEVFRHDTITQVIYCYKRQGVPDKQTLEFCRQTCKGRFAAY